MKNVFSLLFCGGLLLYSTAEVGGMNVSISEENRLDDCIQSLETKEEVRTPREYAPFINKQWKIEKDANEWQLLADDGTKFHIEPFDLDNNRNKYVCPWWKLSSDDSKVVFYVSNNDHKIFVKTDENGEEQLLPQRLIGNLQNMIPLSGPKVEEDMKKIFEVLPEGGESQQIKVNGVKMDRYRQININGRKYSIHNGSYKLVQVKNKPDADIAMSMDGLRPLIVDYFDNPVYDRNGKLIYSRTRCNGVCVGVNAITGRMCGVCHELVYDDQGNLIEESSRESGDAVQVKYEKRSVLPPSDDSNSDESDSNYDDSWD